MASPFSGAMSYMAHREALKEQIAARMQQAMIAEQMRRDQLKALNMYRDQLMQWRGTQGQLAQQKSLQKQAEGQAFVRRLLTMKDDEVDPPVRAQLHALKTMIGANPTDPGMSALAEDFVKSKSKPSPLQFKTATVMGPDNEPYVAGFTVNPRYGMAMTPASGSMLSPGMTGAAAPAAPSVAKDPFEALHEEFGGS